MSLLHADLSLKQTLRDCITLNLSIRFIRLINSIYWLSSLRYVHKNMLERQIFFCSNNKVWSNTISPWQNKSYLLISKKKRKKGHKQHFNVNTHHQMKHVLTYISTTDHALRWDCICTWVFLSWIFLAWRVNLTFPKKNKQTKHFQPSWSIVMQTAVVLFSLYT